MRARGDVSSEFAATPRALLVHDPVAAGAFASLRAATDAATLERDWLFRALPDEARYAAQHRGFVDTLRRHVTQVHTLADLVGDHEAYALARRNPNLVFTRDSLITIPWLPDAYLPARMKEPLRRDETRVLEVAVGRLGLRELTRVPPGAFLEGGDVVPFAVGGLRRLLVGTGPRSSLSAAEHLQEALVPVHVEEIVAIELAPWRMNLDGGLLPVADDVVVADVSSIAGAWCLDARGRRRIDVLGLFRDLGMQIIETTREESVFAQSCNGVCLGERKLVYYDLCPRVAARLQERGVELLLVPGSELVKGRGGPRCMTRPIYRG